MYHHASKVVKPKLEKLALAKARLDQAEKELKVADESLQKCKGVLDALQKQFGGNDFEVLTIATGRNSPDAINRFFEEAGIQNLPRHQDPKQGLASQMGIFGLPITVLLDPEGQEIARLRGDADWSSDSAKAIVKALVDDRTGS